MPKITSTGKRRPRNTAVGSIMRNLDPNLSMTKKENVRQITHDRDIKQQTPAGFAKAIWEEQVQSIRLRNRVITDNTFLQLLRLIRTPGVERTFLKAMKERLAKGIPVYHAWSCIIGRLPLKPAFDTLIKRHNLTPEQAVDAIERDPVILREFERLLVRTNPARSGESRIVVETITELLKGIKQPLIIDVGIGDGKRTAFTVEKLRELGMQPLFVGVDMNVLPETVEKGRVIGFHIIARDVVDNPILKRRGRKADLVFAGNMLYYNTRTNQRKAIRNMLADLKIGGYLYIPPLVYQKVSSTKVRAIEKLYSE